MSGVDVSYTLSTTTAHPFEEALARVREALTKQGFGVLCEIDVRATLQKKLGVVREPYLILDACNPQLAHGAITAEPYLGTLLPCNVVVYTQDGTTHVAAVNAEKMLSIAENPTLADTAAEVRRRLEAVVEGAAAA
ncbi:MAG: DUF302 domain-containing protein [Solirubrobacteraceae bacterium]